MAKNDLTQINMTDSGVEDINNLLYLETLQRYREHEANLRSQAEEKSRIYEEALAEYRYYYELYVGLYECAAVGKMLENENKVTKDQLDQFKSDMLSINRKVISDASVGYFTPDVVVQCQQAIRTAKKFDEITQIQEETKKMKSAVEKIQTVIASIEQKLETVSTRSIDYYLEQLQSKDFKRASNE